MRQCNKQTKPLFEKRFFLSVKILIFGAPVLHGVDDGAQGVPQIAHGIDDAGRDFRKDFPFDQAVFFERAQMMDFIRQHDILPPVSAVYPFAKIMEACMALDGGKVNGKIVVTVP